LGSPLEILPAQQLLGHRLPNQFLGHLAVEQMAAHFAVAAEIVTLMARLEPHKQPLELRLFDRSQPRRCEATAPVRRGVRSVAVGGVVEGLQAYWQPLLQSCCRLRFLWDERAWGPGGFAVHSVPGMT